MSRLAIALPLGLLGLVLYVMAAVALADHVIELHWLVELAYFAVAGIAWTVPARWLIRWAAAAEPGRR